MIGGRPSNGLLMVGLALSLLFMIIPASTGVVLAGNFRDSLGREVFLKAPPQRIVPLAPSITEILYYLGLEDRVAGVTQYSYFPPEAAKKPILPQSIPISK